MATWLKSVTVSNLLKHKKKSMLLLHFTFLWPTSGFHYNLKSFSTKKLTFLIIDSQVFIYLFSPKTKGNKMSLVAMLYLLRKNKKKLINRRPHLIWELCWMGRLSVDSDFWHLPHMKLRYIYVYHHIVWLHWCNNWLPLFCVTNTFCVLFFRIDLNRICVYIYIYIAANLCCWEQAFRE